MIDFRVELIKLISSVSSTPVEKIEETLTLPPQGLGDYAFPCFVIAREQKKNPVIVAKELTKLLIETKPKFIEKIESNGAYVNFFVVKTIFSETILEKIFSNKLIDTKLPSEKILIEYSSPNTNKPLHVGHLRNNVLGLAVSNLLEFTGNKVIKVNLVNDRGIHICKSMLAYSLFGKNRDPISEGKKPDHFVGEMYVLFNEKLKEDPTLEEKARELLLLWEQKDPKVIALWEKMNGWAVSGLKETYEKFGTRFDEWFFESDLFGDSKKQELLQEGLDKGVFVREKNNAIVALLEPTLPNKILMRGDGTSLYATNDLILTQLKFSKFNLDKSIWVVANEQDTYFKQLFLIFEKLEKPWAKNCFHLSYGYVNLRGGKMKSREGNVIDADDLLNEIESLALIEIEKRYPSLPLKEKNSRARLIALSGIKFLLLKNDAKKDMLFDKQQALSFEGETGPYLQYTYARAKSILRKATTDGINYTHNNFDSLTHEKELELIGELANFSDSIQKSWNQLTLHPLCHNLLGIAEKFNSFYHEVPVLKNESINLLNARLSLVEATSLLLKQGLDLLDITPIEEM